MQSEHDVLGLGGVEAAGQFPGVDEVRDPLGHRQRLGQARHGLRAVGCEGTARQDVERVGVGEPVVAQEEQIRLRIVQFQERRDDLHVRSLV
ncbi:hypothetical protein [Streptomyces sp. A0592]|uniref:hypothetical protein n=1 Tax=Streptomyces sp. A0592 TaxID=2563099 RepID=UPI00109E77C2|nr:hypothetical protein [Streptomyces sp. A0592]THA86756.1 hypothetical protein E6U81_01315 [Streptomyces sp. A0592]